MYSITYFIIRQKSTGNVLPNYRRKMGFTHDEPQPLCHDVLPDGPRLFTSFEQATNCLKRYCMGRWELAPLKINFSKFTQHKRYAPNPETKRNIEDFEVIPLTMNW